jgi:hypothetical protein
MITDIDKWACAKREVQMRRRVYPRWVTEGRITQMEADRQIAIMQAIEDEYAERVRREEPSLFGAEHPMS